MTTNHADLLEQTDNALATGEAQLASLMVSMAESVSVGGKLDMARLEALQPEAFRLAHIHAQSRAAREMMHERRSDGADGLGEDHRLLPRNLPHLCGALRASPCGAISPRGSTDPR